MSDRTQSFISLLETILQIQTVAERLQGQAAPRIVEVTDENETVFVTFVPVHRQP